MSIAPRYLIPALDGEPFDRDRISYSLPESLRTDQVFRQIQPVYEQLQHQLHAQTVLPAEKVSVHQWQHGPDRDAASSAWVR